MEQWVQVLLQVPIVTVFVWYTMERDKRDSSGRLERDREWREFMTEQRKATVAAMADVARELGTVSTRLTELERTMAAHNGAMREAVHEVMEGE